MTYGKVLLVSTRAPTDQRERADRILDTAKDLLLRWGYRRVTVDEIARRAGVGKGTIYLHWATREQLYFAVGAREAAATMDVVVSAMRADPAEVALHRYMRRIFVEAMQRPVLRALFTRDTETLGKFLSTPARDPLEYAKLLASRDYLGVLADHGLLREDLCPEDMDYPLPTIVFGFFAIEPLLPPELDRALEDKAAHLADTLRRTFEPAVTAPMEQITAAAAKAIPILDQLACDYRSATYGGTDD